MFHDKTNLIPVPKNGLSENVSPIRFSSSQESSLNILDNVSLGQTGNIRRENGSKYSYNDRNEDMISEFQRSSAFKPQKRKRNSSEDQESEHFRKIIVQETMFPTHSTNDEIIKRINDGSVPSTDNILNYRKSFNKRPGIIDTPYREAYASTLFSHQVEELMISPQQPKRKINSRPYQMLAFCNELKLKDDFYLNIIDWSSFNMLSLGLDYSVYLWNSGNSKMTKLCDLGLPHAISSVKWFPQNYQLAVGTAEGKVQIWDTQKLMKVREFHGHKSRVGTLAWNGNVLSSGSGDRIIYHRDQRCPNNNVQSSIGHKSEICGLKWNLEGDQLASGGNANELFIWEGMNPTPARKLEGHNAAVRAISWSPHVRNLLVSGGGHLDRQIRFWNTMDGRSLGCYNAKSQICNLQWSLTANEIVSTHGWWKNDVIIWKYPCMQKIATLKGHSYRVLYFSLSPNGEDIVTGAGGDDNTLRFWKIFNTLNKIKRSVTKTSTLKPDGLIR
ncbi:13300_t:CDS:2 [Funneliformis mosseae]|uniref:13300_t:CDS:1 n=1 Tax=Funneliformis mosseae TaxID=27381 RepID=A0A9N9C9Y8_FUNMO|nr:13300_t:CDS:2 [Funneliformis mosseae]